MLDHGQAQAPHKADINRCTPRVGNLGWHRVAATDSAPAPAPVGALPGQGTIPVRPCVAGIRPAVCSLAVGGGA